MSIVAGVDFGTLSVRVSIFDSVKGRLGAGTAAYPLLRKREDPDHATQKSRRSHDRAGRRHAERHRGCRYRWPHDRCDRTRYYGFQRDPGGCPSRAHRRLLPLVRPPRLAGGRRDYRLGERQPVWRRSTGAAASTRASGALPSCFTGCATIPISARVSPLRWSIAIWWRPCSAGSPTPRRFRAVSAPWATSGCGTGPWAGCLRKISWPVSILLSPAFARSLADAMPPATRSRDTSAKSGPRGWGCAPEFPYPPAPSTLTGMPSAPASASATWSTWWVLPPALWRSATSPA